MEPILPNDHTDLLDLLISQYQVRADGSESKIKGLIRYIVTELQMLEQAVAEMLPVIDIHAATGAQLDILGSIADLPRAGMTDAAYRSAILGKFSTFSSGTWEQVIQGVRALSGGVSPVRILLAPPAKVYLYTDTGRISGVTVDQVEPILPAGVGAVLADFLTLSDGVTPLFTATFDTILVGA